MRNTKFGNHITLGDALERSAWTYALASWRGQVKKTGDWCGRRGEMVKRCERWNRNPRNKTKARYVVKVNMHWRRPDWKEVS